MPNTPSQPFQQLSEKLDQFVRKYHLNQVIKGLIYFLSISLASYLFLVLFEYLGQFNTRVRTFLFFFYLAATLFIFTKYVLISLFKLLSPKGRISYEAAAKIIGKHFPEVDDKLANLIQLKQNTSQKSRELLDASIEQKSKQLSPIPFSLAVNFGENKKYGKYLLVPLLVFFGLLLFSPKLISDSTHRLVSYSTEFIPPAPFQFVLLNESFQAFKDEDFNFKVKLVGEEIPSQVKIKLGENSFLMRKGKGNEYSYTFNNLQKDQTFHLIANEFESKNFFIKVLPKPSLLNFSLQIKYPAYLNKSNQTLENIGEISVPEGSYLTWTFNTRNTEEMNFFLADSLYALTPRAENEFRFSSYVYQSGYYGINANNAYVPDGDTLLYSLEVVKDKRPSIELKSELDSALLNRIYFKGLVKDDYGFSRLVFHALVLSESGKTGKRVDLEIPINKSLPLADFYYELNTAEYELASDESLQYYFEIWDNDGVNGSKSSRTPYYQYESPNKGELKKKEKESNSKIKDELSESIKLAQEIKLDLEKLKEKMLNKKSLGYQEKKMLEDLLKKQAKVQKSIQKIERENSQKNELQREFSAPSEELLEKQKQLAELFEKIMSDEMKELMAEMEKLMESLEKDKLEDLVEKMELSNEDLEKELDRNLELFKSLELEKKLADATEKLNEIKEKQKEIEEETREKKSDLPELNKKQEELNKEFDELEKDLEEIKKDNQELEEPKDLEDTDSLEEQIKKDMQQSAEELSKKNKSKAGDAQENAGEKMDELAEKLNQMQMEMQSQASAENLEDLRYLLENLIQLSFDQEALMLNLKTLDPNDPGYVDLGQEQKKLKDDAKIIEDSLFALSKRVLQLQATVNREISSINSNMEKAIDFMGERQTPMATSRQQLSMTSINNLALLLDEAIQSMQSQMQMQGNGKCEKPGNGKPSPGSMKSMQEALNKQMEQLKKAMEQGNKPGGEKGDKPGQGKGGMSKELAKMAAKQAAIRQALEQMQESIEGKGNEAGGSLQKLGDLMEETETDLVNKRITNQTILRQQEILTRLLESEKAEKEREKEEKRESTEYVNEIYRNPKQFLEYTRQKEKEIELLKTLPPTFSPFYKQKVTDYFKSIKQ